MFERVYFCVSTYIQEPVSRDMLLKELPILEEI
jgi:hypothetical protein